MNYSLPIKNPEKGIKPTGFDSAAMIEAQSGKGKRKRL